MVDTGGTLTLAAKMLHEAGARDIIACCVHGVLSHPALDRVMACKPLRELVVLDTIPLDNVVCPKLKVLSAAQLLAEAGRMGAEELERALPARSKLKRPAALLATTEVQGIVSRTVGGPEGILYRVKWKGKGKRHNSWVTS
jgi:hypothetical protein